jgi:CheY-like chemotaxis protein
VTNVVETVCAQILALLEHDDNSQLVIESLERSGHDIIRATNFKDAIEFLQNRSVALILSDVHLENGGNVFDFMVWTNRNPLTITTPFVLFSNHPTPLAKHLEDGVRTTARLLGAAAFITADNFNSGEFRRQIDSLLPTTDHGETAIKKPVARLRIVNGERHVRRESKKAPWRLPQARRS